MRKEYGLSQEGLKLIACSTMLTDHIGAVFFPQFQGLRILGRLSFPIYCFLLAEGIHHTRNPVKYGLRLLLVAVLAELPYDLLFYGELTLAHNSVMVTLLLGFLAGCTIKHCHGWTKLPASLPFIMLGDWACGSYGAEGVMMVVLFLLTRDIPFQKRIQFLLMTLLSLQMAGFPDRIGIQFYAVAAMIPITLYSGEKRSHNKAMQWAFTLFYPLHILILLMIRDF